MQSLIGKLQFSTTIVTGGRCFLRRMYDCTMGKTHPYSKIQLSDEVKADLKIWKKFLQDYNGITIINNYVCSSQELHFFTDSSKTGFGGTFRNAFIHGTFPVEWKLFDIQFLELYPIFVLVRMFAKSLENCTIMFHSDNYAIVHVINNQTSKSKGIMSLLRPMVLELLNNNITFKSMHIPGLKNILCDSLSRQRISRELLQRYDMDQHPTPVPLNLLPQSWRS